MITKPGRKVSAPTAHVETTGEAMSDQSPDPGWWQASDGKWYPPEQHPSRQSAAYAPPESDAVGSEPVVSAPEPKSSLWRSATSPVRRWWGRSSWFNRYLGFACVVLLIAVFGVAGLLSDTSEELDETEAALQAAQDDSAGVRSDMETALDQAADDLAAAEVEAEDAVQAVRDELRERREGLDDRETELDAREEAITAFETAVENNSFGDGTYLVGEEIQPGRYRAEGAADCYWERLSGLSGSFDELIANDFSTIVDILSTDEAFTTERCGTWRLIG